MSRTNILTREKKKRALMLLQRNQFQDARHLLTEICQTDKIDADAWMKLAAVNSVIGNFKEVEKCCRQVIDINPNIVDAHYNLGVTLLMQGKADEAIQSCQQVLSIKPDHILALHNLGKALRDTAQFDEALTCFKRVLHMNPRWADAYHGLASVFASQGRMKEAVEYYRQALNYNPSLAKAHSDLLFALNYYSTDAASIFHEHVQWGKNHGASGLLARSHSNLTDPERPLRIGYVSPDLYKHSVAFFFEPLLINHDRSKFESVCYSGVWKHDETTERLRSFSTQWRNTCEMDDEQLVRQIQADKIDILVDLAGHSGNSRLTVFSRKPAPIQITYLGYPNTTGLGTIDYRLTDISADPPGLTDAFHSEKLVRLPHGFLCYLPHSAAPPVGSLPFLSNGCVTFGSFNNLSKITSSVIRLWSAILDAVADSRLIMKNPSLKDTATQERVYQDFAIHGIAKDRLKLYGPIRDIADHQSLYNQIDIALDTFPYNGTTTTCEALWMGVPVITLAGKMHAGRVGVSILTQLGLTECIANDSEDYLRIAAELARAPEHLSGLRSTLRNRIANSPLCDAKRFTQDVEEAYRTMWEKWCAAGNAEQ